MKSFAIGACALAGAAHGQNLFESILGNVSSTVQEVADAATHKIIEKSGIDKLLKPITQNVSKNKFGCLVEESIFNTPYIEKTITAPLVPYHMDHVQQAAHLENMTEREQARKISEAINGPAPVATCEDRSTESTASSVGMFLPVFSA